MLINKIFSNDHLELEYFVSGNSDHQAIVLLHGFPEDAESYNEFIKFFTAKNFYVIAPNQIGYGKSCKTEVLEDYSIQNLSRDILFLLDSLNLKNPILVGHDWGGVIAWDLLTNNPSNFKKGIILSAPHPYVMRKYLQSNLRQIFKSWYVYFFQFPIIPEKIMGLNQFQILKSDILFKSKNAKNFSKIETNLIRLVQNWNLNNNLKYMLNWYRAMKLYQPKRSSEINDIQIDLFWGNRDPYLSLEMAHSSKAQSQNCHLHIMNDIGHWPHHEMGDELFNIIYKLI